MSDIEPTPRVVIVDGVPMSGLFSEAAEPRAVIIAIHGGATTSAYFDCPGHPQLSLLRTGPPNGFSVLALDRPGFGASALYAEEFAEPARRIDMTFRAIDKMLGDRARGAGLFVLAHSNGTELALRLAAAANRDPRDAELLGLEVSGTGLQQQDSALAVLSGASVDNVPRGLRELLWEPADLYPPGISGAVRIKAGPISPGYESDVVGNWTDVVTELAAQIRVPVRYTVAEHERVWRTDDAAVAAVISLFSAAPEVSVARHADGGHNLSLGHSAVGYHRDVLSFAEECRVRHITTPTADLT